MSNYLSLCFVFVFDIQGHLWFSTTNISYIYIYIYHTNIDSEYKINMSFYETYEQFTWAHDFIILFWKLYIFLLKW